MSIEEPWKIGYVLAILQNEISISENRDSLKYFKGKIISLDEKAVSWLKQVLKESECLLTVTCYITFLH